MDQNPRLEALLEKASLKGAWVLDKGRSSVILKTRHTWGLLPLKGVFREVGGSGSVSEDGVVSGTLTVVAASIDTKNAKRDKHLKSADFFDVEKFPDIVFAVKGIEPAAAGVKFSGDLTVRGTTRMVTFPGSVNVTGDNEVSVDAEVPVDRTDYGLVWNFIGIAPRHNTMVVHAVFTKVTDGPASK